MVVSVLLSCQAKRKGKQTQHLVGASIECLCTCPGIQERRMQSEGQPG